MSSVWAYVLYMKTARCREEDEAVASVSMHSTNVALEGVEPFQMTPEQMTVAVARYARRHNEYARTVRQNTELRRAAIREWVTDGRPNKR